MTSRAPILVGVMLLTSGTALSWMMVKSSKDKFRDNTTHPYTADFVDASGIRWKTRVQINGIDVGKVANITHARNEQGHLVARVTLRILKSFQLHHNARVKKTPESLLGDYRIDLNVGSPETSLLNSGDHISNVQSISDMDDIQSNLKEVARNVNLVSGSFATVLSGPEAEGSLAAIMGGVQRSMQAIEQTSMVLSNALARNDSRIDQIVNDFSHITQTIADSTSSQGDIGQTTHNLAAISEQLLILTQHVSATVYGEEDSERTSSPLQRTIESLSESTEHLNSIVTKIDDGRGTLGSIINNPNIAEKVEDTLDNTNSLLGKLTNVQTQIELRTEYGIPFDQSANQLVQPGIKNSLGVRVLPRPDQYYILEIISDPRGQGSRQLTTTTIDGQTQTLQETKLSFNEMKFSAQFAKRYYFTTLRFGITENTGGLGLNLHGFNDNLELRVDIFGFDQRDLITNEPLDPRLRTIVMYQFYNHLWLQAGIDDPLNDDRGTWFIGGALKFTDDDLKTLLAIAPSP